MGKTAAGETVLSYTFTAIQAADGTGVSVTVDARLDKPLDHIDSLSSTGFVWVDDGQILLLLPLQVQDSDGDYLAAPVTVSSIINDGAGSLLPSILSTEQLDVREAAIGNNASAGSHAGTDPGSADFFASGKIVADTGSDAIKGFEIDTSLFNANGALTAGGVAVTLSGPVVQGGVEVYRAYAGNREIFVFDIDSQGNYRFWLNSALDHDQPGRDLLSFTLPIRAVDDDNDKSALSQITVEVKDDTPLVLNKTLVMEEGKTSSTDQLMPDASEGADTAVIQQITVNGQAQPVAAGQDNTFVVSDGTQTVGTLHINAQGQVWFESLPDLYHSGSNITVVLPYQPKTAMATGLMATLLSALMTNRRSLLSAMSAGWRIRGWATRLVVSALR